MTSLEIPLDALEAGDAELLREVDGALAAGAARAGSHLLCRSGCTECCIGPFPINTLDARRLRRGLAELERRDPAIASGVRARAADARRKLRRGFPGDAKSGRLRDDLAAEAKLGPFLDRHAALPCPALDPKSGACQLYAWRPVTCRTYGPPVRIGQDDLPPCHLCFRDARLAEIEGCRVSIDPAGREDGLLDLLEQDGARGETFIAFALGDET